MTKKSRSTDQSGQGLKQPPRSTHETSVEAEDPLRGKTSSAEAVSETEGSLEVEPTTVSEAAEIEVLPALEDESVEAAENVETLGTSRADEGPPAESKDVVPYDPLLTYLREVAQHPRLSKEEEYDLAISFFEHKDVKAAYKLVTSNLWLVVKIAREYERAARNLLDLIQEGNIGLMEAVKYFDPYKGVRLPSYAAWWIKAYIVRYLIANWRMVKIGTTQAQRKLFFNLKKEKERLEREGFFPAPKLLAEKLNVKESEVVEMEQRLGSSDLSVDAPIDADSNTNLLSVLPLEQANAEDLMVQAEVRGLMLESIEEFAAQLKPKEQIIFRERMLAEEKATLQEISERINVSRERVRQIENRLRERLREFIQKKLGTSVSVNDL